MDVSEFLRSVTLWYPSFKRPRDFMNRVFKAIRGDFASFVLTIIFLCTLSPIPSGFGSPESNLFQLIWARDFELSSDLSIRTFLIQENNGGMFVYNGLELWELRMDGNAAKIVDIPHRIRRLRAEAFYYKKQSGECFVVCHSDPTSNFTGAYLFSFSTSDQEIMEVMALPDIGLGDHYTIDYQFNPDFFRVAYWANNNTYYFRINLKSKKVRGFISKFPAGITYASVANVYDDLYYLFNFREKLVLLYDPAADKVMWEAREFINSPFMNTNGETMIFDKAGRGFLIDDNGLQTRAFQMNPGNEGIDNALSPDRRRACFLSENEILMLEVDSGQILWKKKNVLGAKRILRFDEAGIIVSDTLLTPYIRRLHAFTAEGENEWSIKFSEQERPPFDSLIRYQDQLIFINNGTGSIKAFEVN